MKRCPISRGERGQSPSEERVIPGSRPYDALELGTICGEQDRGWNGVGRQVRPKGTVGIAERRECEPLPCEVPARGLQGFPGRNDEDARRVRPARLEVAGQRRQLGAAGWTPAPPQMHDRRPAISDPQRDGPRGVDVPGFRTGGTPRGEENRDQETGNLQTSSSMHRWQFSFLRWRLQRSRIPSLQIAKS